ncbi:MAG TPA: mycofactocin-associated electron transfer flavoprotein beta subunit [Dermatophilaceae bacterium]|nr:mycofactocin-associated electron transfer flavoprotein beta subunit [Dermatophilaceae bacterium]
MSVAEKPAQPARAGKGPLVVVCLRHSDHRPAVDPLTAHVERDSRGAGPAPGEWAALELGLRVAHSWDGRVLAVCAGPPDADRTLLEAAARGSEVLRVVLPGVREGGGPRGELEPLAGYLDELAGSGRQLAAALAAAIQRAGEPALVLCGSRSVDRGTGSVPGFLAAELGIAQALGLVRLHLEDEGLVGERRLDRGRRELLAIPRPAVVSVEAAGIQLRRAGLREMLAAGPVRVPVVHPEVPLARFYRGPARPYRPRTRVVPAPSSQSARERLLALTGALSERTPPTLLRPASAADAADALLAHLGRHGYLEEPRPR